MNKYVNILFICMMLFFCSDVLFSKSDIEINKKTDEYNIQSIENYFNKYIIGKLNSGINSGDDFQKSVKCGSKYDIYIFDNAKILKAKRKYYLYKVQCAGYVKCDKKWTIEDYLVKVINNSKKIEILKRPE